MPRFTEASFKMGLIPDEKLEVRGIGIILFVTSVFSPSQFPFSKSDFEKRGIGKSSQLAYGFSRTPLYWYLER